MIQPESIILDVYYFYYFSDNGARYFMPVVRGKHIYHDAASLDELDFQLKAKLEEKFSDVIVAGPYYDKVELHRKIINETLKNYSKFKPKTLYLDTFKILKEPIETIKNENGVEKRSLTIADGVRIALIAKCLRELNTWDFLAPFPIFDIKKYDSTYYLELRDKYRPETIELIILLESPPISGKYFYDEEGFISEPLFKALMAAFSISANDKKEGLKEFKYKGILLVDSTYSPVNDILNNNIRDSEILKNYDNLVNDLKNLDISKKTPIIIIKCSLYDLLFKKLKDDGFNLINGVIRVPFPSNGNQKLFQEKFSLLLKKYFKITE